MATSDALYRAWCRGKCSGCLQTHPAPLTRLHRPLQTRQRRVAAAARRTQSARLHPLLLPRCAAVAVR